MMSPRLLWTPIDLPRLPDLGDLCRPDGRWRSFAWWDFIRLTENEHASKNYNVTDWSPWVKDEYPQLVEWFRLLPFKTLRHVKINMQTRPVARHVDFTNPMLNPALWANNHDSEPCGYRMLISGKRSGAMWVEKSNGTRCVCDLPEDTDTYVLNHTSGPHGVEEDTARMVIFLYAEIDRSVHADLLRRSVEKYPQHAVWDT